MKRGLEPKATSINDLQKGLEWNIITLDKKIYRQMQNSKFDDKTSQG